MPTNDLPQKIYELRDANFTVRQIFRQLHVSPMMVKYHLRKRSDFELLQFTKKLQSAAAEAPNEFCRSEVRICIDRIRKKRSRKYEIIYPVILRFADEGCKFWYEFQDETQLSEWNIREVLSEMVREGLLYVVQRNRRSAKEYLRK